MKKGERTRQKIIETAAALYQQQGYHATGLKQVLEISQSPKGSMYFHFPGGKEELASAAAARSGEDMREALSVVIQQAESLAEVLQGVCHALAAQLEQSKFLNGCPVATLTLEMASYSPGIQSTCEGVYKEWESVIKDSLAQFDVPVSNMDSYATFVLSAIEGAMLLCRAYQSTQPLYDTAQSLVQFASLLSRESTASELQ